MSEKTPSMDTVVNLMRAKKYSESLAELDSWEVVASKYPSYGDKNNEATKALRAALESQLAT